MGKRYGRNKGGNRAYLKRFSQRSLNTGPSRIASFMNDQNKSVNITLASRNRASQTLRDPAMLAYLNGKYPAKFDLEKASIQELIRVAKGSPSGEGGGNPRAAIRLRMLADALETEPHLSEVYFLNTPSLKVKCFFSRDEATLVKETLRGRRVRIFRSLTYPTITIAKQKYVMGTICWIHPPAEIVIEEKDPAPA